MGAFNPKSLHFGRMSQYVLFLQSPPRAFTCARWERKALHVDYELLFVNTRILIVPGMRIRSTMSNGAHQLSATTDVVLQSAYWGLPTVRNNRHSLYQLGS